MSELSNLIFHNKRHTMTSPYGLRKSINTSAGKTSSFHNGVDYGTYGVKLPQYPVADGILSSDGSIIWHVEGLPEFPEGLCQTVIVEEIEEDEYLRWKERLEANTTGTDEIVEEQTTTTEESTNNDVLESKTSIQTLLTIKELEDKVLKLEKENKILSERILELSEKVNT